MYLLTLKRRKAMKNRIMLMVIVFCFMVFSGLNNVYCSEQKEKVLKYDWVLGGATPGHTTYQVAVAYAKIMEKIQGFRAVVENSGGGYDGIDLTMIGDIDGAATGLIGTLAKYNGTGRYQGKGDKNIRLFMPMYPAPVQIIVLEKSEIKTIHDLKGKRVGTMPVTAAGHTVIMNVLKAAGIDDTNFKNHKIEIIEMVDALKNKTLDAVMINTGVPTSAVMELRATHEIRFIPIEEAIACKAAALDPSTVVGEIPAGTYSGQSEAVPSVLTYAVMCTRADLPEEVVYRAVKAIWAEQDFLKSSHASQKDFSQKWFMDVGKAVPLHPGVEKFAKEMGWK
jgi:uncharacterized protein